MISIIVLFIAAVGAASDELVTTGGGRAGRPGLRIIKGQDAMLGQFPWQVWIQCMRVNFQSSGCGGSLITARHIITAGHCVHGILLCKVSLGLVSVKDKGVSYYLYPSSIVVHEEYNRKKYINDIAIIRLKAPIPLSDNIHPIRLASEYQNSATLSGMAAVISGWGKTSDSESTLHNYLQYSKVKIMAEKGCSEFYKKNFGLVISSGHICTDHSAANVCNGDSGGPLAIFEKDNKWTLIGIVSLGISPCEDQSPSVYTAIASYLSWISYTIQR